MTRPYLLTTAAALFAAWLWLSRRVESLAARVLGPVEAAWSL